MRWQSTIRWLSTAALGFAVAAFAQAPSPLTYRQIREMPPQTVALRLLGPGQSADIERIETRPSPMPPGTLEVRLFHRPVPLGRVYCRERVHRIGFSTVEPRHSGPPADDEALQMGSADQDAPIARAPGCRLSEGQQFAYLNVDADVAMRALDHLADAQRAAGGRGRLPFQLACRDEVTRDADRCRTGARNVLAHLPLQRACLVGLEDFENPRIVEVTLCTDEAQWTLTMSDFGTSRSRLSMLWEGIPPF